MEVKMSREDIIKTVSEKLNLSNPLATLSFKMGKSSKPFIRVSAKLLKYVYKGSALYGIIPLESTKHGENDWSHDMSDFVIYKMDKDFLENFIKEEALKEDLSYEFYVKDLVQVYNSNEGVQEENMDITLKKLSNYDLVCVLLKVPEASEPWINKLINKSVNN